MWSPLRLLGAATIGWPYRCQLSVRLSSEQLDGALLKPRTFALNDRFTYVLQAQKYATGRMRLYPGRGGAERWRSMGRAICPVWDWLVACRPRLMARLFCSELISGFFKTSNWCGEVNVEDDKRIPRWPSLT